MAQEKLLKPAEYAEMVGISRQSVYMKIKRGLIPSKRIDGKLYVIVKEEDEVSNSMQESENRETENLQQESYSNSESTTNLTDLIKAKDETISILKETIADLKESNHMITTTLRSEVELLKDAFNEMKKIYTLQIEHTKEQYQNLAPFDDDIIDIVEVEDIKDEWIDLDSIILKYKIKSKKVAKMSKKIKKLYKSGNRDIKYEDGLYYIKDISIVKKYIK